MLATTAKILRRECECIQLSASMTKGIHKNEWAVFGLAIKDKSRTTFALLKMPFNCFLTQIDLSDVENALNSNVI